MDMNNANKYRMIIRIIGIICAAGAAITAFIFRMKPVETTGACMASRIFAIALFVAAAGLLVFDLATKAFAPTAAVIGLVIALIGFIGNFVVAPGSSYMGLLEYTLTHVNSTFTDVDTTQLEIGSYMVMAAGVFSISWNLKCMKTGT